jgi:predicted RNA-binding Zn ribbon-like protein
MSELKVTPGGVYLIGGRLCLEFCNTVSERFDDQPQDLLREGYRALVHWSQELELLTTEQATQLYAQAETESASAVFTAAISLREAIYQLFVARMQGQPPDAAALTRLNDHYQRTMQQRELTTDPAGNLSWRWRDHNAPDAMLREITLSAVQTLLEDDVTRIRQCPGCGWLFHDHSRNNSRTWCDMRFCGNRAKNKRFHDRLRHEE